VELIEPQALPHTFAAPGLARRYLAARAAAWPAELQELVVLLASELVTNAVLHGRGPVELRLSHAGDRIKIEVSDGDPDPLPPSAGRPPDGQHSGRGLLIVDSLSDRWGNRPRRTPPGKIVWFELRHRSDR
jgi:anti-sigma regulatory factor (Ser/Thr protein kinase)